MRSEFKDETAIAADLSTAGAAVSRILLAWFEGLPQEQREKAADWFSGGIRFGMLIVMAGEDAPPAATIVGVDSEGGSAALATLDYQVRRYSS